MSISVEHKSFFNHHLEISRDDWAVTLIANGGIGGNHAQLVVEGINNKSEVFRKILHLNGPNSYIAKNKKRIRGSYCYYGFGKIGKVLIHDLRPDVKIQYDEKVGTWIRSAEKVHALIFEAEQEEKNQLANPRAFNIFGRQSIFARSIETYKINDPILQAIYGYDPKLLMDVFKHAHKYQKYLSEAGFNPFSPKISKWIVSGDRGSLSELAFDMAFAPGGFTFIGHWFDKWVDSVTDRYEKTVSDLISKVRKALPENVDQEETEDKLKHMQEKLHDNPTVTCREFLIDIIKDMKKVRLKPDSCFTWAREKLKLIDVELESKPIESFISPTKMYATKV